jgi:hypothetical protein
VNKTQISIFLGLTLSLGLPLATPLISNAEAVPVGHPPVVDADPSALAPQTMHWRATGKVLETMDSGGYTYVLVDTGTEKVWAAAPSFAVKVGDEASIPEGATMNNYFSKTLERTFDSVLFVGMVQVGGQSTPQAASEEYQGNTTAADVGVTGIEKAQGGQDIAGLFDQKSTLVGQEVVLRGKVVKFSSGIMGTNWAHIQDGTTSANGVNDLTITTDSTAQVGDTVLVKGILTADKDFGYGYHYDLIIEKASITVE